MVISSRLSVEWVIKVQVANNGETRSVARPRQLPRRARGVGRELSPRRSIQNQFGRARAWRDTSVQTGISVEFVGQLIRYPTRACH